MATQFVPITEIGPYTKGERPETLTIQILDASGAAINLTGFTASFVIEALDGSTNLADGTSSITNAATGMTQYVWDPADLNAAGRFKAQMWVGNGSNQRYASKLFVFDVHDLTEAPSV